jgi:hypothetical protein
MRPLVFAIVILAAVLAARLGDSGSAIASSRCSMVAGPIEFMGVVEDTLVATAFGSATRFGDATAPVRLKGDELLATPKSHLPTARIRISRATPSTKSLLLAAGVAEESPTVIVQTRPYRYDCALMRWASAEPWAIPDTSTVRVWGANLLPRDDWHEGKPTILVPGARPLR